MSETAHTDQATPTHELRTERLIPATPEEVFDAYTDPEKITIWFGLLSEDPGVIEITGGDVRVGGVQTNTWGPNPEWLYHETNTYAAVDRPHRLLMSSVGTAPEMPGFEMTTEIEILFEGAPGGTLMKVHQTGIATEELRDFFLNVAYPGAFDRIVAFFSPTRD
jgi:uncharacterized protein YndB with AHSA1/START domain